MDAPSKLDAATSKSFARWRLIVPETVALQQVAWEFDRALIRALRSGQTQKQLAATLNISQGRISQRCHRAWVRKTSPVERFLSQKETFP